MPELLGAKANLLSKASLVQAFKTPAGLIVVYFIASMLLASLILLRFTFLNSIWAVRLNIFAYYTTYYVIPMLALMWMFFSFHLRGSAKVTNKTLILASGETIASFLGIIAIFLFTNLPEYYILYAPLVILLVIYLSRYRPKKTPKKSVASLLTVAIVLSIFMPLVAASISNELIINEASKINDKEGQVRFISKTILDTTTSIGFVRANNDFKKLTLCGDGACGEISMAMLTYLKKLGFEVVEAAFPGEDHAFIEVKMNGTWLVVDPGYSMVLVSQQNRGDKRVQEAGTLTYVAAYTENGFIERTQDYVSTDTIVIRITEYGQPIAAVPLTLVHTLITDGNARTAKLPGHGCAFYTDANGTVTIQLGKIFEGVYGGSFTKTEAYYTVYINGEPTQYKVVSTGTGKVNEIPIELSR